MTQLELLRRFNRAHAMIVKNLEDYVREHGGCVKCSHTVHMRYLDSKDDQTDTVYQFDHIYIDSNNECIAVYTEDTELGEVEIQYLSCDELHDLILDIIDPASEKMDDWSRYIDYLHEWADSHTNSMNRGMTPVCFDEWCDNERELDDDNE